MSSASRDPVIPWFWGLPLLFQIAGFPVGAALVAALDETGKTPRTAVVSFPQLQRVEFIVARIYDSRNHFRYTPAHIEVSTARGIGLT